MPDRFDKFTENARRVLTLCQEEAQRINHNYIGTEHLLLGILRLPECTAAKILNGLGVELSQVRSAVEFIIGRGDETSFGEIGLTPRAKKVIELAVDEARRLNHHFIGTEHILLGLVREGEGIAASVLESLGVDLARTRDEVSRALGEGDGSPLARSLRTLVREFSEREAFATFTAGEGGSADRFDKFTERSRHVLTLAQEEAHRLGHNFIGTEHLLLGLVRKGDGVAVKALGGLGIDLPAVEAAIMETIGRGDVAQGGAIGLTPRAKKVVEPALDEARRLNHHYIGTEHLLLGMLREGEGPAARALAGLGLDLEGVRGEVRRLLSQSMPQSSHQPIFRMAPGERLSLEELRSRVGKILEQVQRDSDRSLDNARLEIEYLLQYYEQQSGAAEADPRDAPEEDPTS